MVDVGTISSKGVAAGLWCRPSCDGIGESGKREHGDDARANSRMQEPR